MSFAAYHQFRIVFAFHFHFNVIYRYFYWAILLSYACIISVLGIEFYDLWFFLYLLPNFFFLNSPSPFTFLGLKQHAFFFSTFIFYLVVTYSAIILSVFTLEIIIWIFSKTRVWQLFHLFKDELVISNHICIVCTDMNALYTTVFVLYH